jgi:hypothetical protein
MAGGAAQVIEHLPKCEALSSNSSTGVSVYYRNFERHSELTEILLTNLLGFMKAFFFFNFQRKSEFRKTEDLEEKHKEGPFGL